MVLPCFLMPTRMVGGIRRGRMIGIWGLEMRLSGERARVRRKELEEEERLEAELWARKEAEHEIDGAEKTRKSKRRVAAKKGKQLGKDEVVEISESTDAGRPKPRPRKVVREPSAPQVNAVCLVSDATEPTDRRNKTARRNGTSLKDPKTTRDDSHINLCSSSSDATSNASWAVGREPPTKVKRRNGKRQAHDSDTAGAESPNLSLSFVRTVCHSTVRMGAMPASPARPKPTDKW